MKKYLVLALASAAMTCGGGIANASTLIATPSIVHSGAPTGTLHFTPAGYTSGLVKVTPETLTGTLDGNAVSLFAYCIDIFQPSATTTYDVVSLSSYLGNSAKYNAIAALITAEGNGGSAGTTTHDASTQLAVWELAFEGSGSYDIGSGQFYVNPALASSLAGTGATSMISAATTGSPAINPLLNLYVATNREKQDFLFWTYSPSVPEPATWAMMVLGMGAVGGAMRSNKRKATVRFA